MAPSHFHLLTKISAGGLLVAFLCNCGPRGKTEIDYIGEPPQISAEIFAPGTVSTNGNEHSALAFSPDGSVLVWAVMDNQYRGRLLEMTYANGAWSKPSTSSFADTTADHYAPNFSVDGRKLFFSSRRDAPGYPTGRGNRIWSVERTTDGWGTPTPIDSTVSKGNDFSHAIASNETLYFSSAVEGETNLNILKSEKVNGVYAKPTLLPFNINSVGYEDGPYIAPDESYLIFESTRPEGIEGSHDLYISFHDEQGNWGIPINMGPTINSAGMERFPRISPDGKYLFFASNRDHSPGKTGFDFYWIDAKVIGDLRRTRKENENIEQPAGDEILAALDNHDHNGAERLLKEWLTSHPRNLDAIVVYSNTLRKQKNYSAAEQLLERMPPVKEKNAAIELELAMVKFGLGKDNDGKKLLESLHLPEEQRWPKYMYLSGELFTFEEFGLSDTYLDSAMAIGPNGVSYYNRACGYAMKGEKDRAFITLDKAVRLGYNTRENYENDTDLKSLKSDSRWKSLLVKLK